jgi:hypothetical protein
MAARVLLSRASRPMGRCILLLIWHARILLLIWHARVAIKGIKTDGQVMSKYLRH